jgi:hypothetical protein
MSQDECYVLRQASCRKLSCSRSYLLKSSKAFALLHAPASTFHKSPRLWLGNDFRLPHNFNCGFTRAVAWSHILGLRPSITEPWIDACLVCVRCLLELEELKLINENHTTANDIDGTDGEYARGRIIKNYILLEVVSVIASSDVLSLLRYTLGSYIE